MRVVMLTDDAVIDRRIFAEAGTLLGQGHEVILIAAGAGPDGKFEVQHGVKIERWASVDLVPYTTNPLLRHWAAVRTIAARSKRALVRRLAAVLHRSPALQRITPAPVQRALRHQLARFETLDDSKLPLDIAFANLEPLGLALSLVKQGIAWLTWGLLRLLAGVSQRWPWIDGALAGAWISIQERELGPLEQWLLERMRFYRPDVIHAHDLPQLRVAAVAKEALGVPLVYDAHELYPEIHSLAPAQARELAARERYYIGYADAVITVNGFLAEEFAERYGIEKPVVVWNAIDAPDEHGGGAPRQGLRERLSLPSDASILLYQGWLSKTRGLQDLVRAIALVDSRIHLVFLGYGEAWLELGHLAKESGLERRVHFLEAVPPEELLALTATADAGVIPYPPIDLNNRLCSPNKLFEFIQARVPIVANDLPFLREVIGNEGFGVVAPLDSPQSMAAAISRMFDPALGGAARFRAALGGAAERYSWARQAPALLAVYERLRRQCYRLPLLQRRVSRALPQGRQVLLLCSHPPHADPRISWVADHAPAGVHVHVLGLERRGRRRADATRRGGAVELLAKPKWTLAWRDVDALGALPGCRALRDAYGPRSSARHPHVDRRDDIGAISEYLADINTALLAEAVRLSAVDAVIAADLDTLPAAVALKRHFGAALLYDAHEFWPDSNDNFSSVKVEFLKAMESALLPEVDAAYIVSAPLARHLSDLYGRPFGELPNCEPLLPAPQPGARARARYRPDRIPQDACVFLFQGGFGPGRGLMDLVRFWARTTEKAILVLRGPPSEYLENLLQAARSGGLLDRRIFFMPSIPEGQLVAAAACADVGLIPYEPVSVNNRFCCPNKLSQYMAASVPVLSNSLEYVRTVLDAGDAGLVVDFSDGTALGEAIERLTNDANLRRRLGTAGRKYHERRFNWEAVSGSFYSDLGDLVGRRTPAGKACLYRRPPAVITGAEVLGRCWQAGQRAWAVVPPDIRHRLRPLVRAGKRALGVRTH